MKRLEMMLNKTTQIIRMMGCFIINKPRYKHYEFKSIVFKPIEIKGKRFITIGKYIIIRKYSSIFALQSDKDHNPEIVINDFCSLGVSNHIAAVRKVVLGKYVLTANNVYISDNIHEYENINIPIMKQPVRFKSEVSIGDGTWVGENACIIGATVGKNCVIGANAVVTKNIPDFSVAVGNPARVIKHFNTETEQWERIDSN